MKKPSMSKQAMGNFFLHHTEKLILGLCLALFGLFLWMGLSAKPFDEASPSDLLAMNDRAQTHVKNPTVWDAIKPYRKGSTDVLGEIESFAGPDGQLKASSFKIDTFSGIPAKTLDARMDPVLETPQYLHAQHLTAPLLITMTGRFVDPYSIMTPVSAPEISAGYGGGNRGGYEDEMEDEYEAEYEDEEDYGASQGYGGPSGLSGRGQKKEEEEELPPEVEGAGAQVQTVHSHTWLGVNPMAQSISAGKSKAVLMDVVCVTALLDIKKQVESFDGFAGSIGYFPDRDKPTYQHVEVQRREKGGKWVDRSEWVQFKLPALYPMMHNMPMSFHSTAPDNTAPENYDPVLTGPIPPVAMVDYLHYVNHPKLAGKTRKFPELEEVEAMEAIEGDKIFVDEVEADGTPGASQFGNRQTPGRGMPGRGMSRGGPPSGYGGGQSGRGGSRGGSRGGGSMVADQEFNQTRNGGDFSDYMEALQAKRPTEQYKLVRFFDIDPQFKPNTTYEYRVRVWMADPNNEDLTGEFASYQQGGGGIGGRDFGGGDDYEDGMDEDYEDEGMGNRRRPPGRAGVGVVADEDREPVFTWQEITSKMKDILVRRRLNRATASDPDPKTYEVKYTVSELRTKKVKGADGKVVVTEEYETIPVPAKRSYLRHARPSEWSQPAAINVSRDNSQVAVGRVVPPRSVRIKVDGVDIAFPAGEPQSEVVASVWSAKYGTAIPTKQSVSRGELLNFHTVAHIVNPITWKVYLTKNDSKVAQGDDKYKVPIKTGKVVVDAIGGSELQLPRAEKMRHSLASEALIMDASGNFQISNDMEDRTTYRNLLLLPDEPQSLGRGKRPKKKKRDLRGYEDEGEDGYDR